MRPTWELSGQWAGRAVRWPVLLGTTLLGALEILAWYLRVAEAEVGGKKGIQEQIYFKRVHN